MASKNSAEQLKLNQKQNQHFEPPQVNESVASYSFSPSFATPTLLLSLSLSLSPSIAGVRFYRPQITRNHFAFNIRRQKQFKCLKTHLNTTGKTHSSLSLSLSHSSCLFLNGFAAGIATVNPLCLQHPMSSTSTWTVATLRGTRSIFTLGLRSIRPYKYSRLIFL